MKKVIVAALFAATGTLSAHAPVEAQAVRPACSGTCSNMMSRCDGAAGGPGCTLAFKRCMRTGTYVRPVSKKAFSNLCKQ